MRRAWWTGQVLAGVTALAMCTNWATAQPGVAATTKPAAVVNGEPIPMSDVQILLAHKPSDMLTAGDATSQAVAIARDLLHLCDCKVLHGQDQAVSDELGSILGLAPIAQRMVTGWANAGKGRALWLVGDRAFQVQTVLTAPELRLTYTNDAIKAG